MHKLLMLMYVFLHFPLLVRTVVVEERGGYKFAESNNHGISFYLRLGVWGQPRPPEATG